VLVLGVTFLVGVGSLLGSWTLVDNFDHASSHFGIDNADAIKTEYADGGLLITDRSSYAVATGVKFAERHQHIAVEMDMTRRAGSETGTGYGPACFALLGAPDRYVDETAFAFLVFDTGKFELVDTDAFALLTGSKPRMSIMATDTDPALADGGLHRLRIECDSKGPAITVKGYVDGNLLATANGPPPFGAFTHGAAVVTTDSAPAQVLIDNFRAKSM
jgi:hypothetical protein